MKLKELFEKQEASKPTFPEDYEKIIEMFDELYNSPTGTREVFMAECEREYGPL